MKLTFRSTAETDELRLIRQMGATDIVTGRPAEGFGFDSVWSLQSILDLKRRISECGLDFAGIELIPISDRVKLGLPGRDAEIDALGRTIANLGAAGIPVFAYNWMAGMSWYRTSVAEPVRGGALSTAYRHSDMLAEPQLELMASAEQLWAGLEYFLRALVPLAEEAGVRLALHPDDPPVSRLRGVPRILTSPDALQRALDLVPSPCNGLTFCQGCFGEMGADVEAEIRRFGRQGKIHFVHFRNLRGTADDFIETFHDDGQLDMVAMMRAYREIGFHGPIRPDHAPTMEGESNERPGYALMGRMLAIGYMRGMLDALDWGGMPTDPGGEIA